MGRIEVAFRPEVRDAAGERLLRRIREEIGIPVERVRCVDVFTVDAPLSPQELESAGRACFLDPVAQEMAVDQPLGGDCDFAVAVSFRPGVTDNVGRTAREALALVLDRPLPEGAAVYTSRHYLLWGSLSREQAERIGRELLANALIQNVAVLDGAALAGRGFPPNLPRVELGPRPEVETISLERSDEELAALSRRRVLALSLPEMRAIRDFFRGESFRALRRERGLPPDPTDVELECLAQTWSEHCKHKIFNARIRYREGDGPEEIVDSLFEECIRGTTRKVRAARGPADLCLSVFSDNAGVIRFNDDWSLVFKVETHNSPSALDPYGGALTGIVGVNRDPLGTGQGARLIFNTDVFCFASPFRTEPVPPGLLHPRRILEGVREGVEHGGNKSGIPTVNGSLVFDERYLGKPLVFCGTAGLLPARLHGRPGHEKRARPGDRIVMAGGRIGKDGIHGATFSSEELHQHSPVSAVQIGDPITQKRLADFILRARDEGLYHSLTDDGAGGLSSSVGEMAREAGGCRLDLTAAPLKYPGLASWEILLSEAQERMTLSVPPEKLPRLLELARRYQVEATDLGCFEESGRFEVIDHGRTVALLPMDFLHDGLPRLELVARFDPPRESAWRAPARPAGELLHQMLSRLNICSKAYWVRQYDHEVQAGTVLKPLLGARDDGPSDAAVFRPLLDSFEAVAVSHGICPRLSDFDAGVMAECAVDEGVRNAVAVGADPDRMAGLDNFCWCDPIQSESNPDGDRKAGQLVRAGRGLRRVCLAYGIPLISGKDSMKNDAVIEGRRISIPPTLLFSVLGLMPDARRAVSMDAKAPDHALFVLGATRDELLGSELQAHLGASGGFLPRVRAEAQLALYRALYRAIQEGCVASCHDCSDGGLAVALAESAFAGDLGMDVDLARVPREGEMGETELLYSETPGRFVVTVPSDRVEKFLTHMRGQSAQRVGTVTAAPRLVLRGGSGGVLLDEPIEALRRSWLRPLDF